jgi:hypothetical protein
MDKLLLLKLARGYSRGRADGRGALSVLAEALERGIESELGALLDHNPLRLSHRQGLTIRLQLTHNSTRAAPEMDTA